MDLKPMSAPEYMKLTAEELECRKNSIIDLLNSDDTDINMEMLIEEKDKTVSEVRRRNSEMELRRTSIAEVANGAGRVVDATTPLVRTSAVKTTDAEEDIYASQDYMRAFYNFVTRGARLPEQFKRQDALSKTADSSAVIPTTLMNSIVEKMEIYGEIFAKVSKINVQGGVEYPILELKPEAKWVAEDAKSEKQKLQATKTVSFKYHELECVLSQSRLNSFVTLAEFQSKFPQLAAQAMTKAIEKAIIAGTGTGQPLGITKDTRVPAGNVVELTAAEISDWAAWHTKVKAKMAKSYRDGDFIMSQSTFDSYIDGMVDKNGQPVGRTNYGIDGAELYRFMGKNVITTESSLLPDFDTASAKDVVAIFVKLDNYTINSNKQLEINKWIDYDSRTENTGAYMVVDGKLVDPNGVILIKKK